MNLIEEIINAYITQNGTEEEKQIHELYRGDYLNVFSGNNSDLEESVEFGGSEVFVFSVLVFLLECVGTSILQDGYELSKEILLKYLKRDRKSITKKVSPKELTITTETLEKLIVLLEDELKNRNKEK